MFNYGDTAIMHKCPHCGESYYMQCYQSNILLMYYPIYKDGRIINDNPNKTTTYCTCLECGMDFSYEE